MSLVSRIQVTDKVEGADAVRLKLLISCLNEREAVETLGLTSKQIASKLGEPSYMAAQAKGLAMGAALAPRYFTAAVLAAAASTAIGILDSSEGDGMGIGETLREYSAMEGERDDVREYLSQMPSVNNDDLLAVYGASAFAKPARLTLSAVISAGTTPYDLGMQLFGLAAGSGGDSDEAKEIRAGAATSLLTDQGVKALIGQIGS